MIRQVLFGTVTYVPGVYALATRRQREGSTARYCYAVWLRHLATMHRFGLDVRPRTVVELGPGGSHGVGLCALIMGSEQYYGCDVVRQGSAAENVRLFDQLVSLFRGHEPIPGDSELPRLRPRLDQYSFPGFLRSNAEWNRALADSRLARLRASIAAGPGEGQVVQYIVPWQASRGIPLGRVDMVCSQAVLQYIDDLGSAYRTMESWLAPGGTMSHTIDFSAHQTSTDWDAHWTYSDLVWRLMRGKRPYWLNREPCSTHVELLRRYGFTVVGNVRDIASPASPRAPAMRFRALSGDDRTTRTAFLLSAKPADSSSQATPLLQALNTQARQPGVSGRSPRPETG